MTPQNYNVIGVMSGTSLDGIDLAQLAFTLVRGSWQFEIGATATIPYTSAWKNRLQKAVDFSAEALIELNVEYTQLLGQTIFDFIATHSLESIDAVCSHGHTILHQPQNDFTLQIGNLPELAEYCQQKVVCDFRVQDVQLGGQGAPLVPIGDRFLFSAYTYCLNLGGFSNISYEQAGQRLAFDISAVNTVLNFYAQKQGWDFDDRGAFAKSGKVHLPLVDALNTLPYFQQEPPKSLGFEYVKTIILPLIESFAIDTASKMYSFTEHVAYQIAVALPEKSGSLLITGGGAYNDFLVARIQQYLPNIDVVIPNKKTIEFKEALIFGLLGVLRLRNEINVLHSVTGASKDHCAGYVFG
ncbi:MAG: anhydro-N-acetylmuramic acid kinase [Flavobacterium psychrophilum]